MLGAFDRLVEDRLGLLMQIATHAENSFPIDDPGPVVESRFKAVNGAQPLIGVVNGAGAAARSRRSRQQGGGDAIAITLWPALPEVQSRLARRGGRAATGRHQQTVETVVAVVGLAAGGETTASPSRSRPHQRGRLSDQDAHCDGGGRRPR